MSDSDLVQPLHEVDMDAPALDQIQHDIHIDGLNSDFDGKIFV